ncbi:MAG: AraC family transcriptional regulator [Lentisphaeria bacterium]|nr:AraC family transcriptional regulator [Lentisphaeria bacterium]
MLGPIDRVSEKTRYGVNFSSKAFDLSIPSSRPLRNIGLARGYLCTMDKEYFLLRGDNEPLHYDLMFILRGHLTLETSMGNFKINSGDFIHLPSNCSRKLELKSGDSYHEIIFSFMDETCIDLIKVDAPIVRKSTQGSIIANLVQSYFQEFSGTEILQDRVLASYTDLIATYLVRELSIDNSIDPGWTAKFSGLRKQIMNDPSADWSVEKMAQTIFVSAPHLHRLTKQLFGQTPKGFLDGIKMKEARALLSSSSYDLEMIAQLLGYVSAYAFSNAFKRHTGVRPGAFRKQNQPSYEE